MSAAFQSWGEWQYLQPDDRYLPRSSLCGVESNFRSVSARAFGPMNGRHPIVKVMPSTSNTSSATNPISKPLPSFDTNAPKVVCGTFGRLSHKRVGLAIYRD